MTHRAAAYHRAASLHARNARGCNPEHRRQYLRHRFAARARRDPEGTFRKVQRFHLVLLALSLLTILGAVAGSHGLLMFD